jgi:two-component system chemotaxis response regulator CheB
VKGIHHPIRAVVIDDSPSAARVVAGFLQADARFGEVRIAIDPCSAANLVAAFRPNVVTLDLDMPAPGGLGVLTAIMTSTPTPVVVVTGVSRAASTATREACELGAIDFLLKYTPGLNTNPDMFRRELVAKTVAAAGVQVIGGVRPPQVEVPQRLGPRVMPDALLIIGASTGGPPAIRDLLAELPDDFPGAILIAQHIPAGFTGALAAQFARCAPGPVREARTGDSLRPGVTFISPGGCHTRLRADGRLEVTPAPSRDLTPSVDELTASAAEVYGSRLHAVLLSGMGSDGVEGFAVAKRAGAATYAQEPGSCVISGMPDRVIARGIIDHIAPPCKLGRMIAGAVGVVGLALSGTRTGFGV